MTLIIVSDNVRWDFEQAVKKDPSAFDKVLVKRAEFAKDVTWTLVVNKIPFRRINYGSGVVLFVRNDKKICRHCAGKGVV